MGKKFNHIKVLDYEGLKKLFAGKSCPANASPRKENRQSIETAISAVESLNKMITTLCIQSNESEIEVSPQKGSQLF